MRGWHRSSRAHGNAEDGRSRRASRPEGDAKGEPLPTEAADELREIAKRVRSGASSAATFLSVRYWRERRTAYALQREKEKRDLDVYQVLADGARASVEYYVLIVLSCLIATVGLIQGSAAVIIGAMIIAPLMTPILAASLAIIWGDLSLLRTALLSLLKGIVLAVVISALLTAIAPPTHYSAEILSRTRPSVFDIIVALAAGALAAYGNANKKVSNTIVGIAIAVALMPPLCTVGIGIGRLDRAVALGAALLFAINLVSISLAGAVVFWLMKIHPLNAETGEVKRRAIGQIVLSVVLLAVIAVPVGFYMKSGYELDHAQSVVRAAVDEALPGGSVISSDLRRERGEFTLSLTIAAPAEPDAANVARLESLIRAGSPIVGRIDVVYLKAVTYRGSE